MANENLKKFLDSAGVKHLWDKVAAKIGEEVRTEKERAEAAEAGINAKIDAKFAGLGDNTVKEYVDSKTEGLATSGVITDLQGRVGTIESDYVKNAQLEGYETLANANLVREEIAKIKPLAENAATKTYVDEELEKKANQEDFQEVSGTLANVKSKVDAFFSNNDLTQDTIDTLQEIIQLLADAEESGEIIEQIAALEAKVNNKLNIGDSTVAGYVADAIAALSIGDYAKAFDLAELARRVSVLENGEHASEEYVDGRLGDLGTLSDGTKVSVKAYVDGEFAKITALTSTEIDSAIMGTSNN